MKRLKQTILSGFIALAAILGARPIHAQVWVDTQNWDERWEDLYAEWVRTQFNEDFFVSGRWGNMATDCADAVYAPRVIFAYDNRLPFVLPSTGQSNRSTAFNHITNSDQRVRAFLARVFQQTSTKTLPIDTYPIAIKREYLKPGAIWLRNSHASENFIIRLFAGANAPSGHTEVVKDVTPSGVVYLIGSTVPIKVRTLLTVSNLAYLPDKQTLGFRRFIWPQNIGKPINVNPGYSLEQFQMGVVQNYVNNEDGSQVAAGLKTIQQFTKDVQARLAVEKESKEDYITRVTRELCAMLHLRKEVVQDAIAYQKKTGGVCMRSDVYDNFSTPSRDKRIKLVLDQVFEALFRAPIFVSAEKKVERISPFMQSCSSIKLGNGQSLSIEEALMGLARNRWSSDPNQTELARWGLEPASRQCPKP
jgi:hypothetical protein